MNDFAGSADQIAKQLVAGGMEPDRAMMMALRMAQSRQQADESILGGVPTQPPTSDVPPATEILGGDPSRLFQRQPTTMERIRDLPKDVLGAGEALVSMGSLAALAPASMMYALRPGQKTQGDPMEFALRNMYMPRSERGPSHLAGLGEVLESLPQTGPLPELQAFTGVGRGVGRQLAEKGRQAGRAMAPAAANVAEDILSRQGLLMRAAPEGGKLEKTPYERSLEQGYEHGWYHGTTGDIKEFDPKLRGETTGAASAKKGFFFVRDPIAPPESMTKKSVDPDSIALMKKLGYTDQQIEELNKVSFEGNAAETASGYSKIGGSREYKEAMRLASAAERRGDWAEYEKQTQRAEDAEITRMQDAQRSVAAYGEKRDELLDAIQKAVYSKKLDQKEAEQLDEWYKKTMPYGWYNKASDESIKNIINKVGDKVSESSQERLKKLADEFISARADRMFHEQSQQGANVIPAALRFKNPMVYDFKGESYRDVSYSDLVDQAIKQGHDALILRNTYDPGGGPAKLVDVGVVFEPSQIRSKFAKFDPKDIGSADITKNKGGSVNHKAVASARRALEKAMAKGGIAKAVGKAAAKAAVKTEQRGLDLERLKTTGIEVPEAGFSKEDKAVLRPLYNQGLIRVEERDGKKILVPGKGAWYEFATPEQRTRLDALQESQGVKDLSLMGPTESLLNSAQASFYDFEIVPGVRNVPIQSLEPLLPGYESAQEMKRIQNLANQIKESKQIEPLFIGVDPTGIPYIMEGQHRIRALKSLGYEDVPARIVVDMDDVEKAAGGSVKMAGGGSVIGKAAAAAAKQAKAVLSPAESQANLQKMLAESQVKDRLYHGASADIDRFKSKSGEPVFLSPDPNFASKFALDDMLYGASSSDSGPVKSGANVMPVYAQVKNPFDYENPKHIRSVMSRLDHRDKKAFKESAVKGSWQEIEKHLGSIEDSGFDSVFVSEMGRKNLAVFDPKKIKSAIGNQGTYDITSPELNKAHGGLAHMAGGGSMLGRAAKAGAKAAKAAKAEDEKTLPLVLQRAPAKTKQELQAEAERVGRQIIGEHVTKPGDTANLADYSKKVADRLRAMQEGQDYVLRETKPTAPLASMDPAAGSVLIALPGDISIADKELMKLGKLKVGSKQEGGPRYGAAFTEDPVAMAKFWASNYGPANIFQKKVTELGGMYPDKDILGAYMSMGRTGMNFAQHFADANLKAIRSAIKAGDVSKDDIESFNKMIREGWSKINQKTGEREYFKYPEFAGVEKTGEAYAQMMRDPELRKWFNDRMKTSKETASRGLPSGLDIEYAISEPELRNLEHSLVGFSLGRMQPGKELVAPVEHATYSHGIPGQAVGRLPGHVPVRVAFPDAAKVIAETRRPQDFTGTIQKVFPHQVVDQQWQDEVGQYLDYLKRITGRKKGGLMKKSSKLPKVIKSGKVGGLSALRK